MDRYNNILEAMKKELGSRGHDLDHIERVYRLAVRIGNSIKDESIDMEVVKLAALLHDIGRRKEDEDSTGKVDHAIIGAQMSRDILLENGYSKEFAERVGDCVRTHRFRNNDVPESIEAKIIFDADKLDAIGAVGLGRCFYVSSQFDQMLFNPMEFDEYKRTNIYDGKKCRNQKLHSPNMEYHLKLKRIKDRLFTDEAKEIAESRNKFMKDFFDRMRKEIEGIE